MANDDGRAALAYHEATKHSEQSLRAGPHFLDWGNQPEPFKIYTDLPSILLPRLEPGSVPALPAITGEAPSAAGSPAIPNLETLARTLHFSAGVTKIRRSSGASFYFRAAATTGALYHIDLYLVCADLDGLSAGVYHYGPHDTSLSRLREGDHRARLAEAAGAQPRMAAAPAVIISASTYWRNAWKYRARAYRHCFWDGGTVHANLLAVANASGLSPSVVLGFVDDDVEPLLGLENGREGVVSLVPLGQTPDPAPTPVEAPPISPTTLPLSPREIEYPEIPRVHAASSFQSEREVAAWRAPRPGRSRPAAEGQLSPLLPVDRQEWPTEPLEQVILRRGSTRRFDGNRSISLGELSRALEAATAPLPADFLDNGASLLDLYLIVNAVDGLAPGKYYFRRAEGALELLESGNFRKAAGRLALFQELAADAAVNIYAMADLEWVLKVFDSRGYRAAQLEGGIVGGRLYLAAYALRFGATGLTFLDDEATGFFSPHAAGKSVMFLTALGRTVRRS